MLLDSLNWKTVLLIKREYVVVYDTFILLLLFAVAIYFKMKMYTGLIIAKKV